MRSACFPLLLALPFVFACGSTFGTDEANRGAADASTVGMGGAGGSASTGGMGGGSVGTGGGSVGAGGGSTGVGGTSSPGDASAGAAGDGSPVRDASSDSAAASDAPPPNCQTTNDCAKGQTCLFDVTKGCGAIGVCLKVDPPGAICNAISPACTCSGHQVSIICNGLPNGYFTEPIDHRGNCT
jgi:hypothetical protein